MLKHIWKTNPSVQFGIKGLVVSGICAEFGVLTSFKLRVMNFLSFIAIFV